MDATFFGAGRAAHPATGDPPAHNWETDFSRIIFWLACWVFVGAHRGLRNIVPEKYTYALGSMLRVLRAHLTDCTKNRRVGAQGTVFGPNGTWFSGCGEYYP